MAVIEKIKMQGFKSFAKSTELFLEKDFSVILGSNGSGKCLVGNSLVQLDNGSLVESPIAASGNGAGTRSSLLSVGVAYTAVNDFYSGLVDEFGVWSKALSATEITDLYNSGNGQTMIEGFIPQVIII